MASKDIVKLVVNKKLFMIKKRILVENSKYFAALLDGPLAKPLKEDGSLVIDEFDSNTFQNLLYLVREGHVPEDVADDTLRLAQLKRMTSFYMVEIEMPTSRIYLYRTKDTYHNAKLEILSTLLDGPLAMPLDENGSFVVEEEDFSTFKDYLYLVREGFIPEDLAYDTFRLPQLKRMASFYMVEMRISTSQVYTYRSTKMFNHDLHSKRLLGYVR